MAYFLLLLLGYGILTFEIRCSPISEEKGSEKDFNRIKRQSSGPPDPWTLNKDACPPVLCGPEADPAAGGNKNKDSTQGYPFFEGDIVLDDEMSARLSREDQRKRAREKNSPSMRVIRHKRSIVRPLSRLWPNGIIPYVMDSMLPSEMKELIQRALLHIEKHTCIRFKMIDITKDENYIYFINEPGCWSSVGRTGGIQYVSLGPGCEYFGTAVHETAHAIGFWHEQSRLDRDRYVQVVMENVAPSGEDQFGVRHMSESTSRGFAYDYESVMHYGPYFFSKNGQPTLKVIGPGKELGLQVGQRKGLSDLDIAQLRDMYRCNEQEAEVKECAPGWKKFKKRCYLFVAAPIENYGGAAKACQKLGAYPVHIGCPKEDRFLKRYLIDNFPNNTVWRTGGRLSSGRWVWERRDCRHRKIEKEMNYTNWATNHPASFSTLTLTLFKATPPRFVWKGAWAGSVKDLPKYAHSYICETRAKVECIKSRRNGRNYRGKIDYTSSGVTCQKWTSQYPHKHRYLRGERKIMDSNKSGLGNHNFCRNPEGLKKKQPWCYTTKTGKKWDYCDVEICKKQTKLRV